MEPGLPCPLAIDPSLGNGWLEDLALKRPMLFASPRIVHEMGEGH